jgi:4'-phosphopantetheinyl transferase
MAEHKDIYIYIDSICGSDHDTRVRECLHRSGFDASGAQIMRTPSGKPYLEPCVAYFSISHSGGIWACAVSGAPVGFDVEQIRHDRPLMAIAKRFFHPDEYHYLKSSGEREFFSIWTAKESYVKFTGRGLYDGFDHCSILSGEIGLEFRHIPLEGYSMCVCAEAIDNLIVNDSR